MNPVYNTIGKTYDLTRKADPGIVKTLLSLLKIRTDGHCLDVGCGSGNYSNAISSSGCRVTGLDVSETMLAKAKMKYPSIEWVLGDARDLPFNGGSFDAASCILATHHIRDIELAFREVFRTLNQGNFVIFTSFPSQMEPWWLNRYFPDMIRLAAEMMHPEERILPALEKAGFCDITVTPYFVTNSLQDWFLQSGKYRPEIYLDPSVRAGISTFALMKDHPEIASGTSRLEKDIASGAMERIIADHESALGDYVFVSCTKN